MLLFAAVSGGGGGARLAGWLLSVYTLMSNTVWAYATAEHYHRELLADCLRSQLHQWQLWLFLERGTDACGQQHLLSDSLSDSQRQLCCDAMVAILARPSITLAALGCLQLP